MTDALAALNAQGEAVEALVGQAVDVGSTAMAENAAAVRKLTTVGKSAVTRRINGGRRLLDQVGGPGAAAAAQLLATQAEMLGLIPGALPPDPPAPAATMQATAPAGFGAGGYIPGSAAEAAYLAQNAGEPGFIPAGAPLPAAGPIITQGPLAPSATITQAPPPLLPGMMPPGIPDAGPYVPSWADPSWPFWYVGVWAAIQQADGSWKLAARIQWPCQPALWLDAHPEYRHVPSGSPYSYAGMWIPAARPDWMVPPDWGCAAGSISQTPAPATVPVAPGPTMGQGPWPPEGTIGQGPLPTPPTNVSCPPPVINLTCPSCGTTSPVSAPTYPPPEDPKKKEDCYRVELCDADRLVIHSDGSYAVHLSLSKHPEFGDLVSQLMKQVVKEETTGEQNAPVDVPEYESDSYLVADPFI